MGPQIASEIRYKKRQRQETLDALLLRSNVNGQQPTPAVTASEGEPADMTLIIMEEPDSPVLPLTHQSLIVQCSLSSTDAATQMDVHYLVTMDHIYTGKYEIELGEQVEEDSHSRSGIQFKII